ncbi:diacylglycerol/lipid kinase family protein [Bacillus taeanensis]|uniref:Diacylglycerol kinase family lipid kinase n=1 Tax=Bacillus taeanensis TaxID=273032 RepID=A0A366XUQ9_9BACI|nr:diacylglycerol kinase family protein [Bacillus taeanensis]RBW69396.1 diacylglycerol kinase family lipid kinase [Bacillus taeanensis]
MKKAAIILNPAAGKKQLVKMLEEIKAILKSAYHLKIYETKTKGDGAALVKELAADHDLIIGAGGDGTIYELINALSSLKKRPTFAVLPGGTCNDFSRALGLPQNPLKAAEHIVKGKTEAIDIGKSNTNYFSNFWGIGMITSISEQISSAVKENFGRLAYYLSTLQNLKDITPFQLTVKSDSFTFNDQAVMMLVSNGPFIGGMRTFFSHNNIQDGKFDVLIIKERSLESFFSLVRSKFTNTPNLHDDLIYFQTNTLKVQAFPEQQIDCDGERQFFTPSSIELLSKHLNVIVGDKKAT